MKKLKLKVALRFSVKLYNVQVLRVKARDQHQNPESQVSRLRYKSEPGTEHNDWGISSLRTKALVLGQRLSTTRSQLPKRPRINVNSMEIKGAIGFRINRLGKGVNDVVEELTYNLQTLMGLNVWI